MTQNWILIEIKFKIYLDFFSTIYIKDSHIMFYQPFGIVYFGMIKMRSSLSLHAMTIPLKKYQDSLYLFIFKIKY